MSGFPPDVLREMADDMVRRGMAPADADTLLKADGAAYEVPAETWSALDFAVWQALGDLGPANTTAIAQRLDEAASAAEREAVDRASNTPGDQVVGEIDFDELAGRTLGLIASHVPGLAALLDEVRGLEPFMRLLHAESRIAWHARVRGERSRVIYSGGAFVPRGA